MTPEQLTAYALNELPPDERAAFEAQMKSDPALQHEAEEMQAFCALLEREVAQDAGTLMPEQRAQLVQSFQSTRKIIRPIWRRPAFLSAVGFAAAACLAVMLTIQHVKQAGDPTAARALAVPDDSLVLDESTRLKDASEPLAKKVAVKTADPEYKRTVKTPPPLLPIDAPRAEAVDRLIAVNAPPMPALKNQPESGAAAAGKPGTLDAGAILQIPLGAMDLGKSVPSVSAPVNSPALVTGSGGFLTANSGTSNLPATSSFTKTNGGLGDLFSNSDLPASSLVVSGGTLQIEQDVASVRLTVSSGSAVTGGALQDDKSKVAAVNHPEPGKMKRMEDLIETRTPQRQSAAGDVTALEKTRKSETATYRPIIENPFTFVAQQPLSTFSLDVDTASYANVRRFLNSGQRPPPDAVRLEELINYFPYRYEGPGADKPIAVHVDLAEAPWQPLHRLACVAVKARDVKGARSAANFVFLLDVSGSMEPNERLPLIKQSLRLLVEQLREDDRVAIVTYAGESGVALESTPGSQKERIRQAIQKLKAGGSTNGASGIRLAYEQAALNFKQDRINRVILCTDGDFNVGLSNVAELEKLIAEKAKGGVFLSVLGVGTDNLHDHTMQALADRGNGNYHYLDSVGEARKVLVEQMTGTLVTVAKDVKLQIEFNPAQVAAYRLIGYEKRMLAREDFNNDKKDAGEIGAGQTVTALYEIVPASLKYPDGKPIVDDLKYALAPPAKPAAAAAAPAEPAPAAAPIPKPRTPSTETMTVKVRYKEPSEDQSKLFDVAVTDAHKKLSESDRDFRFAVSVAEFGMLVRGSPNSGDLTWEGVRRLALAGKGDDEQGWRGEFIQLIEKARGLCEAR